MELFGLYLKLAYAMVLVHGYIIASIQNEITHWGRVPHICVNKLTVIVQKMACRQVGTKPLSEPMREYY